MTQDASHPRTSTGPLCQITRSGEPHAIIEAPARVMAKDVPAKPTDTEAMREVEKHRRRLRDSVLDLAYCLRAMSGATIPIVSPGETGGQGDITRILVGEAAQEMWGPPAQLTPAGQGFRLVVKPGLIGLIGQTDESCSYALYELLDRLGCRWYMPGPMGESIPLNRDVAVPLMDISLAPATEYRGLWYGDEAFQRRNRQGGFLLSAGHALEGYITKEQREQHPEWRAVINGKPHPTRLKWSSEQVSNAVADAIIGRLEKKYTPSVSLSPDDGADFDESDDKKLDAGDFDPVIGTVSITDRYVHFANRVAGRVTARFPSVKFGFLAYVQYTRPPVREKLHPSLIPQIAPITYCRAHAFTDSEVCPSRARMRSILEGWAKAAPHLSYYNYMFHLAETSVPYPMMDQMSKELPVIFRNKVTYWQPETIPNFESVLPGMWLALRLSWSSQEKPAEVLDEFFLRFYAECAPAMRRYWETFDRAWATSPEHSGCSWGYNRRFPKSVLKEARAAMDDALEMAKSPLVYRRVIMQDAALRQFERFMDLRYSLNEGHLSNLDLRSTEWLGTQMGLAREYAPEFAFNKVGWTQNTIAGTYFRTFNEATNNSAARIVRENTVIGGPLRTWRYRVDETDAGLAAGWSGPTLDDTAWKTTDSGVDTWFALGLDNYYGTVWYRQSVKVPVIPEGKKTYLWLAATDGTTRVFVNGKAVSWRDAAGQEKEVADGYAVPLTFDVSAALLPGQNNTIALACSRKFLNEMGTGGLLGPAYLYRQR